MQAVINDWLSGLSSAIAQTGWLAPLLALFAGVLSSFTPCALSTVSLVIAYVGGAGGGDTRRALKLSAVFSLGMAVTFTTLGILASLLGHLLQGAGTWWYIVLGILMVLMALQTWEIFQFIPSTYAISVNKKRGYWGALVAGILGGLFATPCTTPVLIVLLAIVAERGSLIWGILLLLLYSAGHSTLVMVAGTSVGFIKKFSGSKKYGTVSIVLRVLIGALILLLAFYMFYLAF